MIYFGHKTTNNPQKAKVKELSAECQGSETKQLLAEKRLGGELFFPLHSQTHNLIDAESKAAAPPMKLLNCLHKNMVWMWLSLSLSINTV